MRQRGLTVIVPILQGQKAGLENLLNQIGNDIDEHGLINFYNLSKVHFMRWVIVPGTHLGGQEIPDQLALSTNYDGKTKLHLAELSRVAHEGLVKIYSHCRGFPKEPTAGQIADYLLAHRQRNAAFYVGKAGRTVRQVRDELFLRYRIQDYLQESNPRQDWSKQSPQEIKAEIGKMVKANPGLGHLYRSYRFPFMVRFGRLVLMARVLLVLSLLILGMIFFTLPILILLATLLLLVGAWFLRLRKLETRDARDFLGKTYQADKLTILNAREDFRIQNQITHLVEVKSGWLRQYTLRFLLGTINLLARTVYNRGELGGIPSIHFARWAFIDGGKRLIFFSNFDGSWESYLGEFVDRAAIGLTGVWSNTKEFPPTRKLVFEGAKRSGDFKAWVRSKQIETQVWYSAYKQCTVLNANNNTQIRNGLSKSMNTEETLAWLRRLY